MDIGTTNIKIAQITTKDGQHFLDTYGLVNVSFEIDEKREEVIQQTVEVLKKLMEKAGVTTKDVVYSLPNSAVFTSVIEMPKMTDQELKSAVEFEAKKYVPFPMSELDLAWTTLEKQPDGKNTVLITTVPKTISLSYHKIFELAKLKPFAVEIEALSLIRSVIGDDMGNNLLIDIGAKQTHLNIIEKGNLVLTRNIPVGGESITLKISESLKISYARAEQFKKDFGINQASLIPETIKPILLSMKTEAKQLQSLYRARSKNFDKIIVVGGGSNLPGLNEFLSDLGPKVITGDPLSRLAFSPGLKPILEQYSSNLAVAIGLALRTNK